MTKTRIVIKKVKAKRAPKKFKEGMKVTIKNNKKFNINTPFDGTVGIIKYVGVIDNEKMVGIEIIDDDIWGDSDGTFNGERYFECLAKKGVFVSIKNVKKYIDSQERKQSDEFRKKARERRRYQRNNAQMYGNIVDNLWQQRIDLVRQNKYKVVRKAGPREFGRIEYYGGDEEYSNALNDHTDWLAPRLTVPKRKKKEKAKPKRGPREIGRKESFIGIEYDEAAEAAKRAKKKMELEEKKRKKFEEQRRRKLKDGAITRSNGTKSKSKAKSKSKDDKKVKGKNKGKDKNKDKKLGVKKTSTKSRSKSAMGTSSGKKKNGKKKNGEKKGDKKLDKSKKKNSKTASLGSSKKNKTNKDKDKDKKSKKGSSDASKKKNGTKNGTKPKKKGVAGK